MHTTHRNKSWNMLLLLMVFITVIMQAMARKVSTNSESTHDSTAKSRTRETEEIKSDDVTMSEDAYDDKNGRIQENNHVWNVAHVATYDNNNANHKTNDVYSLRPDPLGHRRIRRSAISRINRETTGGNLETTGRNRETRGRNRETTGRNGGNTDRNGGRLTKVRVYGRWSTWSRCTRSCQTRRYRPCLVASRCKSSKLRQVKACWLAGTKCVKPDNQENLKPTPDNLQENGGVSVDENTTVNNISIGMTSLPPPTLPSKVDGSGSGGYFETLRDVCGTRKEISTRIIGGREARRGAWPWQAVIMNRFRENYCGATLITPRYLLTAAHCVYKNKRKRRFTIRVGDHDLSRLEGSERELRPREIIVHPGYDRDLIHNDIALVKLATDLPVSTHINYACLATTPAQNNTLCYTIGWGKEKLTFIFGEEILREVQVPIQSREACQNAFEFPITDHQICAGAPGRDACVGDSGGSLMCQAEDGKWEVQGVTSFGEGCGDDGKFGVYSSVPYFLKWIQDTIKNG